MYPALESPALDPTAPGKRWGVKHNDLKTTKITLCFSVILGTCMAHSSAITIYYCITPLMLALFSPAVAVMSQSS